MCSNDPNSNGKAADVTSCFCSSGYEWDDESKACKSGVANQSAVVVILAIVTGLLALAVIVLIIMMIRAKRRNNPSLISSSLVQDYEP